MVSTTRILLLLLLAGAVLAQQQPQQQPAQAQPQKQGQPYRPYVCDRPPPAELMPLAKWFCKPTMLQGRWCFGMCADGYTGAPRIQCTPTGWGEVHGECEVAPPKEEVKIDELPEIGAGAAQAGAAQADDTASKITEF